jgi:CrcB protein
MTLWLTQRLGSAFPYGTFAVNLTGCCLMGFLATWLTERWPGLPLDLKLLLTTGFLGAYTTFSTYGLDTVNLMTYRSLSLASLYWVGSAGLGVICVQLGIWLARLR